ncbi:uroplakin-3a [Hyla sarda]|uniref:uroplakin-3a n=1 Tax=Hyla sarda TaxID=327740 RepID=UPI0024C42667|nr:uroplakin-3a [Hyla sarda]
MCFKFHQMIYIAAYTAAPLLCRSSVCQINPTQNTIILEKPFCFATQATIASVILYVAKNSAVNNNLALTNSYSSTNGGSTAPYAAGTFANPNCAENPTIAAVSNNTFRVGNTLDCFNAQYCNGPLANNTAYRFLYAFYDASNNILTSSSWSAPISTRQGKNSINIDTWPGRRSGGMIIITSILSVLMFFILAGFVAAVITYFMTPAKEQEPTRHESRSSHTVQQKAEGGAPSVEVTERYAISPQA